MNFSSDLRCLAVFFVFAAAAFSTACGTAKSVAEKSSAPQNETDNSVQVATAKAEARNVPDFIQATGSLVADESSDVAPKTAGKVTNIYVNVGEFVGGGSLIAKLDDKDARLNLAEAEAAVKQSIAAVRQAEARLGLSPNGNFSASNIPEVRAANGSVEQAQAEMRQTEANFKQAETNLQQAETNEKRYRELVESGDVAMISYEQFRNNRDVARTARDVARAAVDTARTRVNNAKQNLETQINAAKQNNQAIKSAEAAVESARTRVETARQAVADTTVRAPFSGFVSERQTAVGEFVTSSTSIAKILRVNPIKAQIQVPEANVPFVTVGRGVSIETDAYKDRKFAGTVTAINPSLDPNSRSAIIEAQIENGNNSLRSGMFVTVRISKQGGSVGVYIPKTAVYEDKSTQNYRVFVIQEGVAKLKVVQLGTEENDWVQILDGIAAEETVATSNLAQLYEGAKVTF